MDEKDHEIAHTLIIARNRKLAESSKSAIRHGHVSRHTKGQAW
jgi:hypothetical protein